jgi:RNA polymerase sigma-70 factor (ECF subfamily)
MPLAIATASQAPGAPTDEELIEWVRHRGAHLFELLIRRYNRRLYRTVRSVLEGEADVEDVMQQTYVDAFIHLDHFRGEAKFSTWLLKIGIHAALRRRRDLRSLMGHASPRDDREVAFTGASPTVAEDTCAARELLAAVENAIDRLPLPYREVLMLRAVEELDTAETAAVLGLHEEAVRQRLHRARSLLRQQLGGGQDAVLTAAFPFLAPRCDQVTAAVLAWITAT